MDKDRYLGDGLYAEFDGLGIWLRANDHRPELATDSVYLEPGVISAFERFVKDMYRKEESDGQNDRHAIAEPQE